MYCTRITSLSDFAFIRFMSNNLLTQEESQGLSKEDNGTSSGIENEEVEHQNEQEKIPYIR